MRLLELTVKATMADLYLELDGADHHGDLIIQVSSAILAAGTLVLSAQRHLRISLSRWNCTSILHCLHASVREAGSVALFLFHHRK